MTNDAYSFRVSAREIDRYRPSDRLPIQNLDLSVNGRETAIVLATTHNLCFGKHLMVQQVVQSRLSIDLKACTCQTL